MQNVIAPNSVAIGGADAEPVSGTPQYFTSGNPGVTPATVLPGYFLNMIQAELLAFLTAADIMPEANTWNQVLTSAKALFLQKSDNLSDLSNPATAAINLGIVGSLGSSGYQKLPGGLIIQWGIVTLTTGATVSFPTSFPNAPLAMATGLNSNSPVSGLVGYEFLSSSQFNVFINTYTGASGLSASVTWIAIGY